MAHPEYRDHYDGRGKYALENDAMLDQEQSRLGEWISQSTRYKAAIVPLCSIAAALLLAGAAGAVIYYFAAGGPR